MKVNIDLRSLAEYAAPADDAANAVGQTMRQEPTWPTAPSTNASTPQPHRPTHLNYHIVSSQPWDRGTELERPPSQGRAATSQATAAGQRQRLIFLQFEGAIRQLNYREIEPIGARLRPLSHSDNSSATYLFRQAVADRDRLSHKPQSPCCDGAATTSAPLAQLDCAQVELHAGRAPHAWADDGTQTTRDVTEAAVTLASMRSAQPTLSLLPMCSTPSRS